MAELSDLISMLMESLGLFKNYKEFWYWLVGAGVTAPLVFVGTAKACRLWNRHVDFSIFHFLSFTLAAALSFCAVLTWPATRHLDQVVKDRVLAWENHLLTHTVSEDPEWPKRWLSVGYTNSKPTATPWFDSLAFNTRRHLEDNGFRQKPIEGNTVVWTDSNSGLVSGSFEFSEALREFQRIFPFIGKRLPISGDAEQTHVYQKLFQNYRDEKDAKRNVKTGVIGYATIAELIGEIIRSYLIPRHTESLAKWIRGVLVGGAAFSIGIPMIVSGIASYRQIRVNVGSGRNGGKAPAKSRNRSGGNYRNRLRNRK